MAPDLRYTVTEIFFFFFGLSIFMILDEVVSIRLCLYNTSYRARSVKSTNLSNQEECFIQLHSFLFIISRS